MRPSSAEVPTILLGGIRATELATHLQSVLVRCADGLATATLSLVGQRMDQTVPPIELGTTLLEVRFGHTYVFAGPLEQVESSAAENSPPALVLHANGVARAVGGTVVLRQGSEMASCAVVCQPGHAVARGTTSVLAVQLGSTVELTTVDPYFDGRYVVREVRHSFDLSQGSRVEFVAGT